MRDVPGEARRRVFDYLRQRNGEADLFRLPRMAGSVTEARVRFRLSGQERFLTLSDSDTDIAPR